MARYLVLANQTLGGAPLLDELRSRIAGDPTCAFHAVVPATPLDHYRFPVDGERITVAEHRLSEALDELSALDAELTGEVGDPDPVAAVVDQLGAEAYDAVIVSTLPEGISRWVGMDVTSRLERRVDVPVIHVVGHVEPEL